MWPDVVDLRDFYATSQGRVARRFIRRRVRAIWPDARGECVLGLGYATPYLDPFRDEAERVAAVMPAPQGVLHWPQGAPGAVALVDEAQLPFPDLYADKVLLVHAVECSERLKPMLREAWRVLAGGGRLLVVVPNRRGIWARLERTPFGSGHPYSTGQISRLLRENMFTPLRTEVALFAPPSRSSMILSMAPAWERVGARWFPAVSGVVLIEAGKEIYAATTAKTRRVRKPVIVRAHKGAASGRAARESAARGGG